MLIRCCPPSHIPPPVGNESGVCDLPRRFACDDGDYDDDDGDKGSDDKNRLRWKGGLDRKGRNEYFDVRNEKSHISPKVNTNTNRLITPRTVHVWRVQGEVLSKLFPNCTTDNDLWAKVHLSVERRIREHIKKVPEENPRERAN